MALKRDEAYWRSLRTDSLTAKDLKTCLLYTSKVDEHIALKEKDIMKV